MQGRQLRNRLAKQTSKVRKVILTLASMSWRQFQADLKEQNGLQLQIASCFQQHVAKTCVQPVPSTKKS
jgi:hypothetical protein